MLDPKRIRENPEAIKKGLQLKNSNIDLDQWIDLDAKRREQAGQIDNLKSKRNQQSAEVAKIKKTGGDASALIEDTRKLGEQIKSLEEGLSEIEVELKNISLMMPNIPHESVPAGKDSSENVVARTWGAPNVYDFELKDHLEIGEDLDLFDFKRGAKISGRGFPVIKGKGALLERALIQFFLDQQINVNGFTEIIPPLLVNRDSMLGTGQIPKMEKDMYKTEEDNLFLIPTAEVPVTNLHAGETLLQKELPISYAAYSPCFRREAGAWGADTRGFQRLHQFNKVEMVKFVEPEKSYDVLEELVGYAEAILQALGLHYRVLQLCSGDLSFSAAKCYDLEVYSPASQKWLEVSSVSNFEDFQARRANIRFKGTGKPQFVHTLNGSGLATPRVLVALLETYQTKEGHMQVPEVLKKYMNGLEVIN